MRDARAQAFMPTGAGVMHHLRLCMVDPNELPTWGGVDLLLKLPHIFRMRRQWQQPTHDVINTDEAFARYKACIVAFQMRTGAENMNGCHAVAYQADAPVKVLPGLLTPPQLPASARRSILSFRI